MWSQDPVKKLLCHGLLAPSRQHEDQPPPDLKSVPAATTANDIGTKSTEDGSPKTAQAEATQDHCDALLEKMHNEVLTNLAIYEDTQSEIHFNDWLAEQTRISKSTLAEASAQIKDPKAFETLQSHLFAALKEAESYRYAEIELRRSLIELVRSKVKVLFEGQAWSQQIKLDWVTSCRSPAEVLALMEDSAVAKVVLKLYCKCDLTCRDLYDELKLEKAKCIFTTIKTVQKYRNNMKDSLKRCGPCKESVVCFWHRASVQEALTKSGKNDLDGEMKLVFERLVEEARQQFQVRNGQLFRLAEEKKVGRRRSEYEEVGGVEVDKKAELVKPTAKVQPTKHEEPETCVDSEGTKPEVTTSKESAVSKEVLIPKEPSAAEVQSSPEHVRVPMLSSPVVTSSCSVSQCSSANSVNPLLAEIEERLKTQACEKAKAVEDTTSMEIETKEVSSATLMPNQLEEVLILEPPDSRTEAETPASTTNNSAITEVSSIETNETINYKSAGPAESFENPEAPEAPLPEESTSSLQKLKDLKRQRSPSPSEISEAPAAKKSVPSSSSPSGSTAPTSTSEPQVSSPAPAASSASTSKITETPTPVKNSPTNSISIFIAETQIYFETWLENRQTIRTSSPDITLALNSQGQVVLPGPGLLRTLSQNLTLNVITELMKEGSVFVTFEGERKIFVEQILALYFHLELIRRHALTPKHLSETPVRVAVPSTMPSGGRKQLLTALKMAGFRTEPGSTLVQITTAMAIGLSGNLLQTGRSGHMIAAYQSSTSLEAALVHVTASGEYQTKTAKTLGLDNNNFSGFKLEALIDPRDMANRAKVNQRAIGRKFLLVDPGTGDGKHPKNLKASGFSPVRNPQYVVLRGLKWISEFCSVGGGISPKDLYKEKFPYSIRIEKESRDGNRTYWLVNQDDDTTTAEHVARTCQEVPLNPGETMGVLALFGNSEQRFSRRVVQASAEGRGGTRNQDQQHQPSVQVRVDSEGLIKLVIGPRDRRFIKDNVFYMYGNWTNAVAEVDRILLRSK